jgi:hypothetical protein
MRIAKLFGLPAHPLFVHIPVVLIPMVAIGAIAMAFSGWIRDRIGWLVLGFAVIAGISTQFAVDSGQALRHSVPNSAALRQHVNIASSIRPLILLLFLVAVAIMALDRRTRGRWPFADRGPGRPIGTTAQVGLAALTVVVALGTNVRLFQIGDSGAKATWQRVQLQTGRSPDSSKR